MMSLTSQTRAFDIGCSTAESVALIIAILMLQHIKITIIMISIIATTSNIIITCCDVEAVDMEVLVFRSDQCLISGGMPLWPPNMVTGDDVNN